LIQRGSAPLTGTCSDEHMQQDLDAWKGSWELSKEDVVKIGALVDEDFSDEE
jgi:diketogulonate reductase-like aldo/keto reductase